MKNLWYTLGMTNDQLLLKAFKEILGEARENLEYLKKDNFEYSDEVREDCADTIAILEDILPEINGIQELHSLDQEDYAFMFEMLQNYSEVFIVDGTGSEEKLEQDCAEFEQLMDIIEELEKDYVPQDYEYDEEDEDQD